MSRLPIVYQPFGDEIVLKSIDWLENLPWRQENNIRRQRDKYEVTLQVKNFEPEDISVKTADGYVVVECKHEERKDEHGFISRRFTRKYALPDDCRPEEVVSTLSSDGVLTVTAPRQIKLRQDTVIPVTHDVKAKSKL